MHFDTLGFFHLNRLMTCRAGTRISASLSIIALTPGNNLKTNGVYTLFGDVIHFLAVVGPVVTFSPVRNPVFGPPKKPFLSLFTP